MISSIEYNKNLDICSLVKKLVKETDRNLSNEEIKEFVSVIESEHSYLLTTDFEVIIVDDSNELNDRLKFDWFEYNDVNKSGFGYSREQSEKITALQWLDADDCMEEEVSIVFSYVCGEGFDKREYKGVQIGEYPIFEPNKKTIVFYRYIPSNEEDPIKYTLIVYNPTNGQEWHYEDWQESILKMLGKEM